MTARWLYDAQIGHFVEDVAHRDIKSTTLFVRQATNVFEKVCFVIAVALGLIEKIFSA